MASFYGPASILTLYSGFCLPSTTTCPVSACLRLTLPPQVKRYLHWWTNAGNLSWGSPLQAPQHIILTTDASLRGWGAHCRHQMVQGCWSSQELKRTSVVGAQSHPSGRQSLSPILQGSHVLVRKDNKYYRHGTCQSARGNTFQIPIPGVLSPSVARDTHPLHYCGEITEAFEHHARLPQQNRPGPGGSPPQCSFCSRKGLGR